MHADAPPDAVERSADRMVPRGGALALALQEAVTVAVRLRADRAVATSSEAFREQIKGLLSGVDRDSRRAGYGGDDVRLAIYAYIAFLDEIVLASRQPMFQGWNRKPLQEEVFGDNVAGETFFRNLTELEPRQDSEDLADVLEVYLTCLLLGFRGRYSADPAALQSIATGLERRIQRIRGAPPFVGPDAPLPSEETVPVSRDPWVQRLVIAAAVTLLVAVALFVLFRILLGSGVDEFQQFAGGMAS
ncbi:N/A [soil metagenome]